MLLLADPVNVTPSSLPNLLTATFTWSPQTIESLRSAHTQVDLQILPLRGLFHLFAALKPAECVSSWGYTQRRGKRPPFPPSPRRRQLRRIPAVGAAAVCAGNALRWQK